MPVNFYFVDSKLDELVKGTKLIVEKNGERSFVVYNHLTSAQIPEGLPEGKITYITFREELPLVPKRKVGIYQSEENLVATVYCTYKNPENKKDGYEVLVQTKKLDVGVKLYKQFIESKISPGMPL